MVSLYQSIARDSREYQYKKQIDKSIKESDAVKLRKSLRESTNINVSPDGSVNVNVETIPVAPVQPEVVEPEEVIEECGPGKKCDSKEDLKEGSDEEVKECGGKDCSTKESDDKKTITEEKEEPTDLAKDKWEKEHLDEINKAYDEKYGTKDSNTSNGKVDRIKWTNIVDELYLKSTKKECGPKEDIKESEEEIGADVIDTIVAKLSAEDEELANKVKDILTKEDTEEVEEVTDEVIEEEPLEECEITSYSITRVAPRSKVYMLEAQTKDGLKYITGRNFNEETKILDEAEISDTKVDASNRFRQLMINTKGV